jgi:hypothetical protein
MGLGIGIVALGIARIVLTPILRRFRRRHGIPTWTPNEAYLSRLRRWRRDR